MRKLIGIMYFIFFIGCGPVIIVHPAIDLTPFEQIGFISFEIENAEGLINELIRQRFLEEITHAQRGFEIIELGTINDVLTKVNMSTMDSEAAKAIGEIYGVNAFFRGKFSVSDVNPEVSLSSLLKNMRVRVSFDSLLSASLISTNTGGIIWTDSIERNDSLAYIRIGRDMIPFFTVKDQKKVYRRIIYDMVFHLIRDFRHSRRRL